MGLLEPAASTWLRLLHSNLHTPYESGDTLGVVFVVNAIFSMFRGTKFDRDGLRNSHWQKPPKDLADRKSVV